MFEQERFLDDQKNKFKDVVKFSGFQHVEDVEQSFPKTKRLLPFPFTLRLRNSSALVLLREFGVTL